jgi:hypothetical protein
LCFCSVVTGQVVMLTPISPSKVRFSPVCFPNVSRPLFFTSIIIESDNGIGWGIYESDFLASPRNTEFLVAVISNPQEASGIFTV